LRKCLAEDEERQTFFNSSCAKQKSERALQRKAFWQLKIEKQNEERKTILDARNQEIEKRRYEDEERDYITKLHL
jgi:hypothetical protein